MKLTALQQMEAFPRMAKPPFCFDAWTPTFKLRAHRPVLTTDFAYLQKPCFRKKSIEPYFAWDYRLSLTITTTPLRSIEEISHFIYASWTKMAARWIWTLLTFIYCFFRTNDSANHAVVTWINKWMIEVAINISIYLKMAR